METLLSAFLGPSVLMQIKLANPDAPTRAPKRVAFANGGWEDLVVCKGSETVAGEVTVSPARSGKVEHIGLKVELVGFIQPLYGSGGSSAAFSALASGLTSSASGSSSSSSAAAATSGQSSSALATISPLEFLLHVRELEPAGVLDSVRTFKFAFDDVDKPHESYNGAHVRLRYFVRVTLTRNLAPNVSKEQDFWVVNVSATPSPNDPSAAPLIAAASAIKSQVGIRNCLLIEVEWARDRVHLKEIIFGKVTVLQVRVKIAKMKISLVRKERTGMGENSNVTNETVVAKDDAFSQYEVMDGCPVQGEVVPVRLFLSHYDSLTPTYKNVHSLFSVRYYINVVLIDEQNRRYFKHEEIFLVRKTAEAL